MIFWGYFSLVLVKAICCGYSLKQSHQYAANEYLLCMFYIVKIRKNIPESLSKYSSLSNEP